MVSFIHRTVNCFESTVSINRLQVISMNALEHRMAHREEGADRAEDELNPDEESEQEIAWCAC